MMLGLGRLVARIVAVGLVAATASATPVRAQEATPEGTVAGPGSLAAMLQLAPATIVGEAIPLAAYADLAAQTAISGVPVPTSVEDDNFMPWVSALEALYLPDQLFLYAQVADWRAMLGFDLWEIEQSLMAGAPPSPITFLRGRFDEAALRAAWANNGYRLLGIDGLQAASRGDDDRIDPTDDLARMTFGRYDNVVILPDGTLAFARGLDQIRMVVKVATGAAPSLGDRVDVASLVAAIAAPLASAVLIDGAYLQGIRMLGPALTSGTPVPDALATEVAGFAAMPPIVLVLFGVTPGGPLERPRHEAGTPQLDIPPAMFEIALLLRSEADAATAARVASQRLATLSSLLTRQPLTEFFASWNARALPAAPIAVIEIAFAPGRFPRLWLNMIGSRDLLFLAW